MPTCRGPHWGRGRAEPGGQQPTAGAVRPGHAQVRGRRSNDHAGVPCQRVARNCATRSLASPHHPTLDSASHLRSRVGRRGGAWSCEPLEHRWHARVRGSNPLSSTTHITAGQPPCRLRPQFVASRSDPGLGHTSSWVPQRAYRSGPPPPGPGRAPAQPERPGGGRPRGRRGEALGWGSETGRTAVDSRDGSGNGASTATVQWPSTRALDAPTPLYPDYPAWDGPASGPRGGSLSPPPWSPWWSPPPLPPTSGARSPSSWPPSPAPQS
jgi:hypothetical protein